MISANIRNNLKKLHQMVNLMINEIINGSKGKTDKMVKPDNDSSSDQLDDFLVRKSDDSQQDFSSLLSEGIEEYDTLIEAY